MPARHALHGGEPGLERHRGPQAEPRGRPEPGHGRHPVHREPRAHEVVVRARRGEGRGGVREVTHLGLETRAGGETDGLVEHVGLRDDARVAGLVGERQVGPRPDEPQRPLRLRARDRVEDVGQVRGHDPVAPEPRVDGEVHARGPPGGPRGRDDLVDRPGGGERHVDLRLDERAQRRAGRVEPGEDPCPVRPDPGGAQRERLARLGGPEPRRAAGERREGARDETVAVGVRLHDGHDPGRRREVGEGADVVADRGQVDDGARGVGTGVGAVRGGRVPGVAHGRRFSHRGPTDGGTVHRPRLTRRRAPGRTRTGAAAPRAGR